MTRLIKYSLLNKSELEYEVSIRAEKPADTLTNLKDQMTRLSHILPEDVKSSPISLKLDLSQAENTLNYIESKISHLESGDKSGLKKIEAFVNHLYHRFERIIAAPPLIEFCSKLRSRFFTIQKQFEMLSLEYIESSEVAIAEIHSPPASFTHGDISSTPPTLLPPQINQLPEVATSPLALPLAALTSYSPQLPNIDANYHTSCNFVKELKTFSYNGKSCPRSFLQRLEEFRISRNISEIILCRHAFEIFTGDALHWFRFQYNRNPTLTWNDIHMLLIKDFGIHDYDYKLLEAIRNRTQGTTETIIIYVSIMSGMFARLSKKLNESEQLEILLHNIRPCYSVFVALKEVKTIDSLISTCQSYEKVSERDNNFREPSSEENTCAAEFAYRPSTSRISQSHTKFTNAMHDNKQLRYSAQINENSKDEYCYRCRTTGHSLRTCTKPRYLICFKCGRKGVKISDCPNCASIYKQKN